MCQAVHCSSHIYDVFCIHRKQLLTVRIVQSVKNKQRLKALRTLLLNIIIIIIIAVVIQELPRLYSYFKVLCIWTANRLSQAIVTVALVMG